MHSSMSAKGHENICRCSFRVHGSVNARVFIRESDLSVRVKGYQNVWECSSVSAWEQTACECECVSMRMHLKVPVSVHEDACECLCEWVHEDVCENSCEHACGCMKSVNERECMWAWMRTRVSAHESGCMWMHDMLMFTKLGAWEPAWGRMWEHSSECMHSHETILYVWVWVWLRGHAVSCQMNW